MAVLSFLTYLRGIYKINLAQSSKVHYAIIQSLYDCFVMAQEDLDLMRLEMCLSTATGYWLDCWGDYFSVYRKSQETDENYSKRVIDSVIQPKSTIPAIKDSIVDHLNSELNKNYTREDVAIKEPWKEVAKYSHKGTLSNDARFFSEDYYCHAVIDISIPEEITPELIDLVNSVKAAGVKVLWSILNSYDIVSGFNDADDAWAAYTRHIQTKTQRRQYTGLILSNSSPNPVLSGRRETWFWMTSTYQWFAKILDKETDKSVVITKKDLIGLLDYYTEIETRMKTLISDNYAVVNGKDHYVFEEGVNNVIHQDFRDKSLDVSNKGTMSTNKQLSGSIAETETIETLVKITNDMLKSLELMDSFMSISYQGRMSTSSGTMFKYTSGHELWNKLMRELNKFKQEHLDYYNSVQPPILNGERAMWLVQRNKNWLWNTPTMTHQDFFDLWEPFDDYEEYKNQVSIGDSKYVISAGNDKLDVLTSNGTKLPEHTLNSIIEFEDAYYKGYITFGDKYQPPIVVGAKFRWTPLMLQNWLFNSPAFCIEDLPEIYRRQFAYVLSKVDHPNPTIEDINLLEKSKPEKFSTAGEMQPIIEVKSEKVSQT